MHGYIDGRGQLVIAARFERAERFLEGLAAVALRSDGDSGTKSDHAAGQRWGFIDPKGDLVIPAQFSYVGRFSEGMTWVEIGPKFGSNRHGYIDKTGRMVIAPELDFIFYPHGVDDGRADFKEGLAVVKIGKRYGYVDKAGRLVIKARFEEAYSFSEGLAVVRVRGGYGYIDRSGKLVISPKFEFAMRFSEGKASVRSRNQSYYINGAGELVLGPFQEGFSFSEGLAGVRIGFPPRRGYINHAGEMVVEVAVDFAGEFSEGLAIVRKENVLGYIDTTGAMIIEPQLTWAEKFEGGMARVDTPETKFQMGYINRGRTFVWRPDG